MKFSHAPYHSMDQGFYQSADEATDEDLNIGPIKQDEDGGIAPSKFGFGSNPFQQPIQAVNARIKQGVGYIDIPFFGAGKGNKERYTPESISQKERRDIKELAEINEVKLSTHASTNIQGLAGLSRQGFDDKERENTLKEIKKAVDFASDLQGGAVVFHTGEWERPFSEAKWNENNMFVNYPDEERKATLSMVDDRTGDVIGQVQKSQVLHEPVYEEDETGNYWITFDGNKVPKDGDYTDSEYIQQLLKRQPKWKPEAEEFETRRVTWDQIEQRAEDSGRKPEEEFYFTQLQEQLLQSRGQSLFYSQRYENTVEQREALENALEFYEQLEDNIPEEEKWKLMRKDPNVARGLPEVAQGEVPDKSPKEIIESQLRDTNRQLKHIHEASAAQDVQAQNALENLQHIEPIADYGKRKSADTIARAAEYAHEKTRQNNPERDIYVSPESFMPEQYGSHPDEIRELINQSRNRFVERMTNKGYSENQAEEMAKRHIKGTLDVGHFNMWRQHFKKDEDMSPEQREKEFNKWYLNEVQDLIESDVIGQVHITDNMGFDDEHLSPGEGNVPMKEVMDIVEDAGVEDMIVEAGSFNPVDIVEDTWSYFGSPIYGVTRPTPSGGNFSNIYQGHFGYKAPPFYVVGAYAPSNEWQLWSEVQME